MYKNWQVRKIKQSSSKEENRTQPFKRNSNERKEKSLLVMIILASLLCP